MGKMNRAREFTTIQNVALGGLALWSFANEYHATTKPQRGPALPLVSVVLPLVFHKDSLIAIADRQLVGGLYRALSDVRTLPAGLQDRMEAMLPQTFGSLRTAIAAGLITYDRRNTEVIPLRRTAPYSLKSSQVKMVERSSRRLGHWFATTPISQLGLLLNVRF
jgi:ABC-3C biological conflict system middle component